MSFFAGLNDEKYDRQYTDRDLTRRIAGFFSTQKNRLGIASVMVIALAFIGVALPVVVSRMVDLLKDKPSVSSILLVGLALVGVGVGLWALNWFRRSLIVRAVGDVVLELR